MLLFKVEFSLIVKDFISFMSLDNALEDFFFGLSQLKKEFFLLEIRLHILNLFFAFIFSTIEIVLSQFIFFLFFLK